MTRDRLIFAIDQAARFLEHHPLRGDQAWLIKQGAARLGSTRVAWANALPLDAVVLAHATQDPKSHPAAVEGLLARFGNLPPRTLPPLPVPVLTPMPLLTDRVENEEGARIVELMTTAVVSPADSLDETPWPGLLEPAASGYLLTHQLIALMLAHQRGCVSSESAAHWRKPLAECVLAEQLACARVITDLAVERMAALCMAGLCDWIPRDDLNALLLAQQASGAWGSHGPSNLRHVDWEPHTVALAFFTLTYFC
jgi:hypothetical protein